MLKRVLPFLVIVLGIGFQAFAQSGGAARKKENLDLPFDAFGLSAEALVIIFFGQSYEGDRIFYCLDRSSSVRDGELAREKQEVVRNINEFSERIQFGIVFYDRGIQKHPANSRPTEATPGGKAAAIGFVMSRQSGGGSCAGKGVLECIRFANASSARRNVIIAFGDGCTHCPGMDAQQHAKQALAEIAATNFKRHQINSILVGNDTNCKYWAKPLADMNGGKYAVIAK